MPTMPICREINNYIDHITDMSDMWLDKMDRTYEKYIKKMLKIFEKINKPLDSETSKKIVDIFTNERDQLNRIIGAMSFQSQNVDWNLLHVTELIHTIQNTTRAGRRFATNRRDRFLVEKMLNEGNEYLESIVMPDLRNEYLNVKSSMKKFNRALNMAIFKQKQCAQLFYKLSVFKDLLTQGGD